MSNNNKTPAIRFKGFTDTWEQREFDKVFLSFPNKNYQLQSTEYYESGKFPIIDQGKKAIIGYSDNKSKVCNKYPSIIFGDHTTELKYVDFPFIIGADGVKTLSVKDGDTLFQYYNLQVNNVQPTGYNRHFSMLKEISLCVPCLAEQRQIGTYFRNLDTLITLHQRKYDKLIQFKAAMLKKMFPQNGADKPEIRFKGFTDAWEQRKLDTLVEFYSGLTYKPEDVTENGTLVLRSSNVKNAEVVLTDNVYVDESVVNSENVKKDDIIVVVRNGSKALIGKHAKIRHSMPNTVIGAFMTGIRSDSPDFINALLSTDTFDKEIKMNMGATINQITGYMFANMEFMTPSFQERQAVGSFFSRLDDLITLHQRKCDKYKSIKAGLIRKLFP